MKHPDTTSIIIAGVGGQGNILASKILAECAKKLKLKAIVGEVFGVSQRGGSVTSQIRIGSDAVSPVAVEHGSEFICGLEPMEALRAAALYVRPDGVVLTNVRPYPTIRVNMGKDRYPAIGDILAALEKICKHVIALDATSLAEKAGGAVFANMVLLGALSTVIPLKLDVKGYEDVISMVVPRFSDKNIKAFQLGRQHCLVHKS